jgi:undecaprenyl-diphosphatase
MHGARVVRPAITRPGPWLALLLVTGAAATVLSVAALHAPPLRGDLAIARAVQAAPLPALDPVLALLNNLGFPPFVDIVYGLVVLAILRWGRRWDAVLAAVNATGGAVINWVVKAMVPRVRPAPTQLRVEEHLPSSSFPAGHVLDFTAFAGILACLALLRMRSAPARRGIATLLVLLAALMGVARIRSGEHWPSDVLGGALLGLAWLAATMLVHSAEERRRAGAAALEATRPLAAPRPVPREP